MNGSTALCRVCRKHCKLGSVALKLKEAERGTAYTASTHYTHNRAGVWEILWCTPSSDSPELCTLLCHSGATPGTHCILRLFLLLNSELLRTAMFTLITLCIPQWNRFLSMSIDSKKNLPCSLKKIWKYYRRQEEASTIHYLPTGHVTNCQYFALFPSSLLNVLMWSEETQRKQNVP
jgi:hypothetical protein